MDLAYGSAILDEVDLSLDGPAFQWSQRRTYNSTSGVLSGVTFQGNGWLNNNDSVYLIQSGSNIRIIMSAHADYLFTLSGGNYTAPADYDATLVKTSYVDAKNYDNDMDTGETIDLFTLVDRTTSKVYKFAGFDADVAVGTKGKLVELTNEHWADDASLTGSKYAYDSSGRILTITTPTGQEFEIDFTYANNLLTKIEIRNASSTLIAQADYTYFSGGSHHADVGSDDGDLVQVKVSRKTTGDTGDNLSIVRYTQYRYDSASRIKAVYAHDGIYRALNFNGGDGLTTPAHLLAEPDNEAIGAKTLEQFASQRFTYYAAPANTSSINTAFATGENLETRYGGSNFANETGWVASETIGPGGCTSCQSGSSIGVTRLYFYMTISHGSPTQNDVVKLVVEDTKDAAGTAVSRRIWGLNSAGRMLRDVTILNPVTSPTYWCTSNKYHASLLGRVTEIRMPSAHKTVVDDANELKAFLDPTTGSNDGNTLNDASGLIYVLDYNADGRLTKRLAKNGETQTAYYLEYIEYGDGVTDNQPKHLPIEQRVYPTLVSSSPETNGLATTFTYTFWDASDTQIKTRQTTLPAVSSGQNGSGIATSTWEYWDAQGRPRWTKDGEGYVNYYAYHPNNGELAYTMVDVDTDSLPSEINDGSPGLWIDWDETLPEDLERSATLPALERVTKREYDDQGRETWETTPSDQRHYTRYDADRTLRFSYVETDAMSGNYGKPMLPVEVFVEDNTAQVTEVIEVDPATATATSGVPTGISAGQGDYVRWTKYVYDTFTGELAQVQQVFNIPDSGGLTEGTHYYGTYFLYDTLGRRGAATQYVASGKHQVFLAVYDALGRMTELRQGVLASVSSTYAAALAESGVKKVAAGIYDENGVGDGHLTKIARYFGTGTYDFTGANFYYNFRGHRRLAAPFYMNGSTETALTPQRVTDYDWQGRPIAMARYASTLSGATVVADVDYAATIDTDRHYLTKTLYDDVGRVYQTQRFPGPEDTNHLLINSYYDRNDRLVCLGDKYSTHTEYAYDGAGRRYQTRTVKDVSATKYSSGAFVYVAPAPKTAIADMPTTGDAGLIEFTHTVFDSSSSPIEEHMFEANHSDANGIDIDATTSYVRQTMFYWYDGADRLAAMADYGSGDTTAGEGQWKYTSIPARPETALTWTDATVYNGIALLTRSTYDVAGRQEAVITGVRKDGGNNDTVTTTTKVYYDDLGRRTSVAENWVNFTPPSTGIGGGTNNEEDRVTKWEYNGVNQVAMLTAYNGSSMNAQETEYLYTDDYNAALVELVKYPDGNTTVGMGADNVQMTYNLDGTPATRTDQRGTVITYTYNTRRQPEFEKVTTLGGDTDGHVRAIKREYDTLGRLEKVASAQNSDGSGTVRNQVQLEYNAIGRLHRIYQSHEDAVNTMSTPYVEFAYAEDQTSNIYTNGLRRRLVTYPGGRPIHLTFSSANSVPDRLHRVDKLQGDFSGSPSTEHTFYEYNGTGRLVEMENDDVTFRRRMYGVDGAASSVYNGFDRFGRVVRHEWRKYSSGSGVRDRADYTYDYAGNRTSRNVRVDLINGLYADARDQGYAYDGLQRLVTAEQGTLSGGSITSKNFAQDWTLDQLGNRPTFKQDDDGNGSWDLNQSRTHNAVNELTEFTTTSWVDPVHDAAGNMTTLPQPKAPTSSYTAKYDAWNRLVEVRSGMTLVTANEYDGLHQRIVRDETGGAGDKRHFYYNDQWQVLEERVEISGTVDPDPVNQYLWHPYYIDAMAVRWYDADHDGSGIVAYYPLHDANFNVTAVLNSGGDVVERYAYSPYGEVTFLNADFSVKMTQASAIGNNYLYTGRERDPETGLQLNRNRFYHAGLGRWLTREPMNYWLPVFRQTAVGYELVGYFFDASKYQYLSSNPSLYLDPYGLGFWGAIIGGITGGGTGAIVGGIVGGVVGGIVGGIIGGPPGIIGGAIGGAKLGAAEGAILGGIGGATAGSGIEDQGGGTGDVVGGGAKAGAVGGAIGGLHGGMVGGFGGAGGAGGPPPPPDDPLEPIGPPPDGGVELPVPCPKPAPPPEFPIAA